MSKFLKCDMHLHSRRDNYNKDDFISALNNSDLDVACVTDHNIIDLDLLNDVEILKNGKFAGVELNLHLSNGTIEAEGLVRNPKSHYFHSIVWFEKEMAYSAFEKIKELFQKHAQKWDIDDNNYKKVKIKYRDLSQFYKECLDGVSIDLEQVQNSFSSIPYYLIPHENKSGKRSISEYLKDCETNNKFKTNLLCYNNVAIEGKSGFSNEKARYNNSIVEHLVNVEKLPLANFKFSDAVDLKDIGKKYNWINFDGSFFGMILPFSDPESRIVNECVNTNPQANITSYLEKVEFEINKNPYSLTFEPGYNAIIGSRGSGKSLLGNILGRDVDDKKSLTVSNIKYFKKGISKPTENFKYVYIGQSYFDQIFNNGGSQDFHSITYVDDINRKLSKKIEDINDKSISNIKKILQNMKDEILKLTKDFNKDLIPIFENENSNNRMLSTLVSSNIFLNNLTNEIKILKDERTAISNLITIRNSYTRPEYKKPDIEKFFATTHTDIKGELECLLTFFDDKSLKLKDLKEQFLSSAKTEILEEKLQYFVTIYNHEIDSESSNTNTNIKYNRNFYREVSAFLFKFNIYVKKIEELYSQLSTPENETIITPEYMDNKFKRINEIKYEISVKLNVQYMSASELFDSIIKIDFKKFIKEIIFLKDEDVSFNGTFLRNIKKTKTIMIDKVFEKLDDALQKLEKDYITSFSKEGKDFLKDMSPGQRAQSLLDIIFTKEIDLGVDYIVIDQPEDNLDNITITDDLVQKIRREKRKIQIFVISHSAPVVVNGDSDLVIVAKAEKEKAEIVYTRGEMNNEDVKNSIIKLLDGGRLNLNMRYLKYEMNRKGENEN